MPISIKSNGNLALKSDTHVTLLARVQQVPTNVLNANLRRRRLGVVYAILAEWRTSVYGLLTFR